MKGIIALDIDGTITMYAHEVPSAVVDYFSHLTEIGWRLMFITGRTFSSGYETLRPFPFPYDLAVQNGAIIMEMPSRRIIAKKYLDRSIFAGMEQVCQGAPSDFVVYGGFENNDVCYFRPKRFSASLLAYLGDRVLSFNETWHALESYEGLSIDEFPSVKCFGLYPSAIELAEKIESNLGLHVPVIRDPFNEEYYVVQATHPQINKGQALRDLINYTGVSGRVIAAGDDYNDKMMLEFADIKVVMSTAPQEMLLNADVIAPPASEMGIIAGLEAAINF